jgi:hypothetical protein
MYLKLLQAMEDMSPAVPPVGQDESALSDELDLFVTTTDIRGAVVPLRLADKVVYEKRHKQVMQLQYRGAGGRTLYSDFRAELTPSWPSRRVAPRPFPSPSSRCRWTTRCAWPGCGRAGAGWR